MLLAGLPHQHRTCFYPTNAKLDTLCNQLVSYGFRGSVLKFFESYLKIRKICTKVDNILSRFYSVSCGVPQGSVLGPILFLLYVNDLPNVSKFKTTLFADDTNLHMSHSDLSLLQMEVSQEINKVDDWLGKISQV